MNVCESELIGKTVTELAIYYTSSSKTQSLPFISLEIFRGPRWRGGASDINTSTPLLKLNPTLIGSWLDPPQVGGFCHRLLAKRYKIS